MAYSDDIEKTIAKICKRHEQKLQRFMREDFKEIPRVPTIMEDPHEKQARTGAYGKVIDLQNSNGDRCVGKVLHSAFFDFGTDLVDVQYKLEKFFQEIETLSRMNHSNIVRFLGVIKNQGSSLPVLLMEKMVCNLTDYLKIHDKGSISEDITLGILLDVAKGLFYLHEIVKVAHRDLSSNNILLSGDLSAKISDLGSARVLDRPGGWNTNAKLTMAPGTQDFMPPEALNNPPVYSVSVDVFSFGCVIIHLQTHKWPSPITVPKGEFISEFDRRREYLDMNSPYLLSIVEKCLEESSEDRLTSTVLVESLEEQVRKGKELIHVRRAK